LKLVGFDRNGAFAEYISIPESNVIILKTLPSIIGAVLDPFGNAIHAVSKVRTSGLNILVTGCGPLGLMTIALARFSGARLIIATDISDYRLELAQEMGADITLNVKCADSYSSIDREVDEKSGVDVFLEMSGSPEAIIHGFDLLRPGGHAVLMGLPIEPVVFDFANSLVAKGITVHGVVGRLMYETWERALDLLYTPNIYKALNLEKIITHRFMISDYDKAFASALSGQAGKVIIFFNEEELKRSYTETLNCS
jgi:threonine 3-dehydrogenase